MDGSDAHGEWRISHARVHAGGMGRGEKGGERRGGGVRTGRLPLNVIAARNEERHALSPSLG